jgi:hypothetical protein
MKITSRIKLGQDEFELSMDVADEREFFQQMSFYSSLPRTAPNGADDLKVRFRTTKDGDTYYSLVSETEKMEFKLGQQKKDGRLFPKGWEPLYQANGAESDDEGQQQTQAAPRGMPKANTAPAAAATPTAMPTLPKVTPAAMPKATEAPAQAATPAAATTNVSPAVATAAASVLSRFNKKA